MEFAVLSAKQFLHHALEGAVPQLFARSLFSDNAGHSNLLLLRAI